MERPEPRTLLERLVQESDRTLEEMCEGFERCARQNNELRSNALRPATRSVDGRSGGQRSPGVETGSTATMGP